MHRQRHTLIAAVNSFLVILLVLQLWMLVALEHLAEGGALLAVVSAACAIGAVALARSLPR
jgi:hypothetical protein